MNVQPLTLTGQVIRLEPLTLQHAPDLLAAGQVESEKTFAYFYTPTPFNLAGFEDYVRYMLSMSAMVPFATVLLETGQAIGVTTYMDIQPAHRNLEIGFTWMGRAYQGTKVNPEAKYMLLRHAFEEQGALRVQLKTDLRNLQSQRAIEKLGAKKEGVLRKHRILQDGYIRDSVLYSILDTEWPEVKAGLEARLR